MTAKDVILRTYGTGETITKSYLSELTAADLLVRPVPGQNHIAWQLGHLLLTEHKFVEGIKPGASPKLPPDFEEGHGRDKTNVDDPSKYLAPEDYLRLIESQREATKAVLNELDEPALDAPGPERMKQMAPTVGAGFALMGNHMLMHVGQFVAVRRKLGKPIAF
ncbi:MAG TPA: DinB family protein [Isosphaeraceae bacterium]